MSLRLFDSPLDRLRLNLIGNFELHIIGAFLKIVLSNFIESAIAPWRILDFCRCETLAPLLKCDNYDNK
jgi:hypothetical protein